MSSTALSLKDGYILDSEIIEESTVIGSVSMEYGIVQQGSTISASGSTDYRSFTQAVAISGGNVVNSVVSGYGLIQGLLSDSSFLGSYNPTFIAHISPGASVVANSRYSGNAEVSGFVSGGSVVGHSTTRYRSYIHGSIIGGRGACLFGIDGGITLFGSLCAKKMTRDEEGNVIIVDYPETGDVGVMSSVAPARMLSLEKEKTEYDKIEMGQLSAREEYLRKTAELRAKRDLSILKNKVMKEEKN